MVDGSIVFITANVGVVKQGISALTASLLIAQNCLNCYAMVLTSWETTILGRFLFSNFTL